MLVLVADFIGLFEPDHRLFELGEVLFFGAVVVVGDSEELYFLVVVFQGFRVFFRLIQNNLTIELHTRFMDMFPRLFMTTA